MIKVILYSSTVLGDIAFRFLNYVKNEDSDFAESNLSPDLMASDEEDNESLQPKVTVCDINQAMLDVGKKRATETTFKTGKCLIFNG